jgi:ligand-binding sensor domain-containing protein
MRDHQPLMNCSMLVRAFNTLVVLLLIPAISRAERLPSRVFTTADGLPHNTVSRIVSDSRGYQWLCTGEGLSRFDGNRFVTYGIEQGLPTGPIRDLLETRDGAYWVATGRGLVRFDPMGVPMPGAQHPMFSVVATIEPAAPLDVFTVFEDRDGEVWAGARTGLYRLNAPRSGTPTLARVNLGTTPEVLSLAQSAPGELWLGTNIGLFLLRADGRVERYARDHGLPATFITTVLSAEHGALWVGTTEGGLALIESGSRIEDFRVRRIFTDADGLGSSWINDVLQTSKGEVWIATAWGIARMRPDAASGRCSPCADSIYVGANSPTFSLAEDRSHNMWVGTRIGVVRVLTAGFALFSSAEGIPAASTLMETTDGVLLAMTAGTTREGAAMFDGRRFVPIQLPTPVASTSWGWNQLLLQGRHGDWWIGTRSGALHLQGVEDATRLYHPRAQRRFSTTDGLANDVVLRLLEDSRGDVWIATVTEGKSQSQSHGLSRWERSTGALHHYQSTRDVQNFARYYVTAFAEDRSGNIWMGFSDDGGLVRLRDDSVVRFTERELGSIGAVHNLLVGADGTLWAATTRGGLLRVATPAAERPIVTRLTVAEGLSSNDVGAVVEDRDGGIYAGTASGIDRIDQANRQVFRYGAADGMPVGQVYAALRDRHGALWFGYTGGIVRFNPDERRPRPLPSVVIDGLTINDRAQHLSALGQTDLSSFELPPGRTALQVSYVAPGLGPMDRVRYQIRLEGVDADWSQPSDQRTVSYASIGPGSYRFNVRALTAEGLVSSNVAGFEFRVLSPIWQRWWFLPTALVFAGAAGYRINRYRIARVLQLANVRARIARDLHDDIGANFTRIAVLAEVVRRQKTATPAADGPLNSIATVARESMTAMGEIVWAVNPDRDRVGDLAGRMREYAEEVFVTDEVSVTFLVPENLKDIRLGGDVRRDVYLVFKEAANNAARHSGCSHFHVEMTRDRRCLTISIQDEGRGFEVRNADGNGLSNMRRRAALVGGTVEVHSSPGRGTTVTLAVPVGLRSRLFG